jgi:hypothetical protein
MRTNKLLSIGLPLLIGLFSATSCTWVKPTEEGVSVDVLDKTGIENCKQISTLKTSVKHTIGSMNRNPEKVHMELVTLARNEAALRNGNTIVPLGPVTDGAMTFDVYQCP